MAFDYYWMFLFLFYAMVLRTELTASGRCQAWRSKVVQALRTVPGTWRTPCNYWLLFYWYDNWIVQNGGVRVKIFQVSENLCSVCDMLGRVKGQLSQQCHVPLNSQSWPVRFLFTSWPPLVVRDNLEKKKKKSILRIQIHSFIYCMPATLLSICISSVKEKLQRAHSGERQAIDKKHHI